MADKTAVVAVHLKALENISLSLASLNVVLSTLVLEAQNRNKAVLAAVTSDNFRLLHKKCRKVRRRQLWIRPRRSSICWNNFLLDIVVSEEWKENFLMPRESFLVLCEELRPYIERSVAHLRETVSAGKQVAVSLYYLADEGRMRKIANSFGLGKATASQISTKLPSTVAEVEGLASEFYSKHGFPQCIGAIDGTRVGIKRPSSNANDSTNRKGHFTLNCQATCDHK